MAPWAKMATNCTAEVVKAALGEELPLSCTMGASFVTAAAHTALLITLYSPCETEACELFCSG